MAFSRLREEYVSVQQMNEHLKYVFKYYEVIYRSKDKKETFKRKAFLENKQVFFRLTYKKGTKACTYICRKDSEEAIQAINGGEAFRILSTYYKVPKMDYKDDAGNEVHVCGRKVCGRADEGGLSASPLLWYNPKFEGQWLEAYCYDLNSAYSAAMLGKMPDTSVPMRAGIIKEGEEIGFEEVLNPKKNNKATMLVPKYKGFSLYIFPLMDSPFKKFVEVWYDKKVSSLPGSFAKLKAKSVLNFAVGQLQNVNPFIRATIIGRCNELIESLIDEDTLFCNTDSIVSKKPLNLDIGDGIGQWKIEHKGKVAYKGYAYQWDNGEISYRHVPKSWFKPGWDITKDKLPTEGNIYEFKDNQLRRIKHENI